MENTNIIFKFLGKQGFLLASSKGQYRHDHPDHFVIFNANICTKKGKIWYGDIDITEDEDALINLARSLQQSLYILKEGDARFENESKPKLKEYAVFITQFGDVKLNSNLKQYFHRVDGKILQKPIEEKEKKKIEINREYLENDYTLFKLDFKKFTTKTSSSPIDQLSKLIIKHRPKEQLSVCDIYLSEVDFEKLRTLVGQWLIDYHRLLPDGYPYKKNLAWAVMDMPNIFYNDKLSWLKPNHVYIRKISVLNESN